MDYERAIKISKNAHNLRKIENATHIQDVSNKRCGDNLTLYLLIRDGKIEDASFDGMGCAAAIAGFSILTEAIKNSRIENTITIGEDAVKKELKIEEKDTGSKCAFLSLEALKAALVKKDEKY
ncbi:MAG: iron-sulfur cluster assembly scaffold protein [Candidatus Bilamarchaeaceae archaeon]